MWADTFTHTCACTLALTLRHTLTHSHTCSVVRRRRRRWPTCNLSGFGGHSIAWLLLHTLRHRTDWGISTLTCRVAGAVEKPPRMGKGNVLFQLRFAEMQLKTCNLFDVSVFLYEFIMLGTSTPACLRLLPFFTSSSSFRHLCHCLLALFSLFPCVFLPWLLIYNAKGSPKLMQCNAIRSELSYLPCGLLIFEASHTHTYAHMHTR